MHGRVIAFGTTSGYFPSGDSSNSDEKKDEATLNSVLSPLISKCASIRGISLTAYPEPVERLRPKVLEMFKRGKLRYGMDDVKFVWLDSISDALEYVMARKNIRKVAVKIQDLP
ncbi:putative oxidoreductase [Phytophthora sojae]|uniref:Oxidoreductase n=1 Tax=Phytophthora sojae (strain P6497) TaxID=1094619 RepID=G4Z7C8_PHYSP|nr:putative oxidoreductase [Phytophthora sojae]EGZ19636.1 putative oxidoreductase [Phytophthora sojae]|eukprot:XP_009522353.1 putative oxidoreductase [Phytophthora sojae]